MTIRIVVVDDHSIVREGLRLFLGRDLELEIVGEAADGVEAVEQVIYLFAQKLPPGQIHL